MTGGLIKGCRIESAAKVGIVAMTTTQKLVSQDDRKRAAALEACMFVKPKMSLGLGTGSTVQFMLDELGRRVAEGLDIVGVPTSKKTEDECKRLKIPLTTLDDKPKLDLMIDGCDEIDSRLNLIKGGGGALVREKVVASSSQTVVIIADESKYVARLGSSFPVPVEVLPFGRAYVARGLKALGANAVLRVHKDGKTYVTDNGGYILDARFAFIQDPVKMEQEITLMSGVLDCGIFTGLADIALVATAEGVHRLTAPTR